MKLKKNEGRVVHSPLSFVFQMVMSGGSLLQKYDASTQQYIPDRLVTPVTFSPKLIVSDPDGSVTAGDYTSSLVNVTWSVTRISGSSAVDISPVSSFAQLVQHGGWLHGMTNSIVLAQNVTPSETLRIRFSADYTDTRRNEVHHFEWEKLSATETQTDLNVVLDTGRCPRLLKLLPFKHLGQFGLPVQLKNGPDNIPDASAEYRWQWMTKGMRLWSNHFDDEPWYVSGCQTKEIVVDQDYIQDIWLRMLATPYGNYNNMRIYVIHLKRWYGQFDYDVEFLRGKYVFHDTDTVALGAWVANAKGIIAGPCRYFDMELFFSVGNNGFESVGYGEEAVITRSDLKAGQPKAGVLVRELSAYRAICDEYGYPICMDDGTLIFAQFPTKSREVL